MKSKLLIIILGSLYFLGFVFIVWPAMASTNLIGFLPNGILVLFIYTVVGIVGLAFLIYKFNNGKGF